MMSNSILLLAVVWACCVACYMGTAPFALSSAVSLPASENFNTSSSSSSSSATLSAFNTAPHSAVLRAVYTTNPVTFDDESAPALEKRQSKNWYARCRGDKLSVCTNYFDLYCDDSGQVHSDSPSCDSYCTCVRVPVSACFNRNSPSYYVDCNRGSASGWNPFLTGFKTLTQEEAGGQVEVATADKNASSVDPVEEAAAYYSPMECDCGKDYCLGGTTYNSTCWSTLDWSEQNSTALQMCSGHGVLRNVNTSSLPDATNFLANTSSCISMLDSALSPELTTHQLTAQTLYTDNWLAVAQSDDCYLWITGGENATKDFMAPGDAFVLGNYDLAEAVLNAIELFAESGNVTTMAATGPMNDCPVYNLHDFDSTNNKTGQIGFTFAVGGSDLPMLINEGDVL